MNGFIQAKESYTVLDNNFLDNEGFLTSSEKLVMVILYRYARKDDNQAFPAVATIAAKTGLSDRTVRYALKSLCEKNVLVKESRKTAKGDYTSNIYTVVPSKSDAWVETSTEAVAAALSSEEEKALVAILAAKGYNVTKKESVPAGTSTDSSAPKSTLKTQDNRTTYSRKKQSHINGSGVTAAELERSRQAMMQMLGVDADYD